MGTRVDFFGVTGDTPGAFEELGGIQPGGLTLTGFAPGVALTNVVPGPIPEPTASGNLILTAGTPGFNISGVIGIGIAAAQLRLIASAPQEEQPPKDTGAGLSSGPQRMQRRVIIGSQLHVVSSLAEQNKLLQMHALQKTPKSTQPKPQQMSNRPVRLGNKSSGTIAVVPSPAPRSLKIGQRSPTKLRLR